jgi:hypothetical protein
VNENSSRRELLTNVAKALPLAAVVVAVGDKSASAAPKGGNSATAMINSVAPGVNGFVGTINVTGVQNVNGVLTAAAQLTGTVIDSAGNTVGTLSAAAITAPITQLSASCTILNLVLGPLDLNLLGLMVHLNQVVLNIVAVPGAGNLLGNLLCAVANLLNGGGALAGLLNSLVDLLNQILGSL